MGKPTFDLCCSEEARFLARGEAAQGLASGVGGPAAFFEERDFEEGKQRSLDQQRSNEGIYSLNTIGE
jgi:hypothetical protein